MKMTLAQTLGWILTTVASSVVTFAGMWFLTNEDGLVCILISAIIAMAVGLLVDGYIDVLNQIRHESKRRKG